MRYASSNRTWYESRGMLDHPNCRDNETEAMPSVTGTTLSTPSKHAAGSRRMVLCRFHQVRRRRFRHDAGGGRPHRHPDNPFFGSQFRNRVRADVPGSPFISDISRPLTTPTPGRIAFRVVKHLGNVALKALRV